jgi:hypothetical protein
MRRAWPERGENSGPGKDFNESLTTDPELENSQGQPAKSAGATVMEAAPP